MTHNPTYHSGEPVSAGEEKTRRPIRSFVIREGRLTRGQQRAFEQLWPHYGIDFADTPLDLEACFGDTRPVYVEIGFGDGESLVEMAAAHPENNYLGIEVHRPGVGHLLLQIEKRGLANLRVIRHDAVEVMAHTLVDASLQGVFLFFPDPWHKRRHQKRRILQPTMVEELARLIRPGGLFHAATDWQDYAAQMMAALSPSAAFENCVGPGQYSPRPDFRPVTKFERRGQKLGHGVWDLLFRRR
ncbi:MAG: tRNA (guanosine(46)-N7)-methyltransferase TrmB [Gammaproteobacteria bacterium]|nr:tRNA (guanosine(46)-N7)-methyltransferase TrmB [Gammaproteobacteria bacterium]